MSMVRDIIDGADRLEHVVSFRFEDVVSGEDYDIIPPPSEERRISRTVSSQLPYCCYLKTEKAPVLSPPPPPLTYPF